LVIYKFRNQYAVSEAQARDIFTETKKWLWFCARLERQQRTLPNGLRMRAPVIHVNKVIIDEMWHVFILFMRDYQRFCEEYLGGILYHSPGSPLYEEMDEDETRAQLECISEELGDETLRKWYVEYGETYSPANLLALLKPPVFGRPPEAL
jgi:hypothetical protein